MKKDILNVRELCKALNLRFIGENAEISGMNLINQNSGMRGTISYLTNDDYLDRVNENESISILVVSEEDAIYYSKNSNRRLTFIISKNPEEDFYTIHEYIFNNTSLYKRFTFDYKIGKDSNIHPTVIIEEGVIIGNRVKIGAYSVIKRGSVIEDDVTIGCNTVIGAEGFQIIDTKKGRINIKHIGGVLIKRNVYIGNGCSVCNNLFEGETIIEENSKIDNLVHVAHNCYIGKNAVLTAGVILCGSSVIEDNAWVGVNSSVLNKIVIGSNSKIGIGSVVGKNVPKDSIGVPRTGLIISNKEKLKKND